MAKFPLPGAVKTRLGATLGPEAAAALARAFIEDLAARLTLDGWDVVWAVAPPGAPFGELVPHARTIDQAEGDLGERMAAAVRDLFATNDTPVLVLGTDTPHAPLAALDDALVLLAAQADVVLGPAEDGGYWLVGLRCPVPDVFCGIPWSTSDVFAATARAVERRGLHLGRVATTFDVDDVADLERLRAAMTGGHVSLPRTAVALASLADTGPRRA